MLVVVNVESVVYAVEYDIVIDADGVVDAAAVDVSVVVIVVVDGDVVSVFGTISPKQTVISKSKACCFFFIFLFSCTVNNCFLTKYKKRDYLLHYFIKYCTRI